MEMVWFSVWRLGPARQQRELYVGTIQLSFSFFLLGKGKTAVLVGEHAAAFHSGNVIPLTSILSSNEIIHFLRHKHYGANSLHLSAQ